MARGHFNPDINPRLLNLIEGFKYGKYGVNPTSGYRPGDPRQHGRGQAIDIQLNDPKTGAALANYQDPSTFAAYQEYANALYRHALQTDPELAKQLRWGGYFSGGKGKYGALDLMHFDTAGQSIGMAGGSWEGGLTPEQAQIWGLQAGGGISGGAGSDTAVGSAAADTMAKEGYTPEQIKAAFLSTIASGESPGYDVMYGGAKFSDYSRHPHQAQTARGITSDVAGRYQFKGSTWDELARKYGYKDFTPATQDTGAWQYANDVYKAKTGGSLEEALASGDPARINAASQVLNKTWTSLPGGAEQSKGYGAKTFADIYNQNLGVKGGGGSAGDSPSEKGGARFGGTGLGTPNDTAKPPEKKKSWWENMLSGLGEGAAGLAGAPAQTPSADLPAPPRAVVSAPDPVSMFDPQAAEIKRQRLAEIIARLNPGKIV